MKKAAVILVTRRLVEVAMLMIVVLVLPFGAYASDELIEIRERLQADSGMADVADVGSAAGFDKRLPPVLPGENIQHNGRTMKVWSSSGPVPVGAVPQPPSAPQLPGQPNTELPNNIGIILDSRQGAIPRK